MAGNADTATKLATARNINGVKFDGSVDISIPTITSRGRVTALTGTTQGAATGLQMYEAYNNGYPSAYGNVLHLKGATAVGEGELFIGWSGTSGAHAPVHVRSRRDTDTASWSEWAQVYTSKDSIPGVNTTGNQNTTGNAASATKLQTARTIGGVSFNGTANIDLPGVNKTGNQSTTGNAATATKLQTARTIGGVSFDGSANIDLPGVNKTGNQNTTGNAATATKLQTARTINGVSFDGSKNIELTAEDLNLQETVNKADNAVQKTGDTLSGGLTFENDSVLAWIRNTDWAKIGFKNDADSDTDSYMWFETGDNGNEYFKWRSKQSTTTKDLMNLKWDALSVLVKALFSSEVKISTVNALRIFNSSFGAIFRRSEECLHIIPTRENEGENGDIGPLRPFTLNLRTGRISMGHGLDVTGGINGSLNGNAATATKLQTARTIGGVSFDGSANIDLPGVNKTGNQNTTGNAATATKLQTARTINGVSFDGSKNIELTAEDLNLEQTVELAAGALQKNQNGADIPGKDTFTKNIGACRAFHSSISTGAGNWTTAQLIEWLDSQGAFNHPYWMCKCSWSYANNKIITDTGCGTIHLAGCVIEVMGNKGAMTIRVTTPSTSTGGGTTNAQFTYINHGDAYAPGWRRDYNTKNQQPAFALGQTGSTVGNDKAVGWNSISGVYNANIGGATTLILHFYMGAGSCPAVQFRVNYKNGGIYYRSARDGYGFEADWSEFYTTTRKPSAGDVGAYTKAECDSRFITGIRLGTKSSVQTWNGPGWNDKSGYVVTASINSNKDELIDTTQARPVQYCINGTWYNAGSI
ncbi:phage tail fiber protein [Shigella flexneri]